jgi:alkanesulfonate monooxygenase SsuD/methylene tetrahydromethanopterin reductase-like flavin-dependent oxidoreductase (luciferase family)
VGKLRFSVWPSPQREWSETSALARWVDGGPWHGMWCADHFMPNSEDETAKSGDVAECWSTIAAIAAITNRIRVGSLVSPTTFRHPVVLANTAATIDRQSNGRLVLGVGAGWQVNEHHAYGVDLMEPASRVDRFEESIVIINDLLTKERTTFQGRHFVLRDAPCEPKPVQSPLPILVGTGGRRMTGITARHAHEWNTWGTPETAAPRIRALREACDRIGRDPGTVRCSVQALFFRVDDENVARNVAKKAPFDRSIVGNADVMIERIGRYRDLGFDEIIVPDFVFGDSAEARRESYERFARDVIPAFF